MSKYAPLADFLVSRKKDVVRLSFKDVEKALGFKLPNSAYTQRAWWSNNVNNNVMTRVWKRAGFRTRDVDMTQEEVVFERLKRPFTVETIESLIQEDKERSAKRRLRTNATGHPIRGALKGILRLVGGTDLTKPADPEWGHN
jgi:hypothetical protein